VCAIAEDDLSRAVFVEVLDSCRLTPDERRMILEKLAAARGDRSSRGVSTSEKGTA
jgi:hypothetical protein